MAKLYNLTLDELIEFDVDLKEIEQVIKNTNEEKEAKINWTKMWGKKYPVLNTYQEEVDTKKYVNELRNLLEDLQKEYGYNELDSLLVLKDILGHCWKKRK